MSKKQKDKWVDIGTLRKNSEGKVYLVLDPSVKLLVGKYDKSEKGFTDFEEVNLGKYRKVVCANPESGINALLDGQHISEDEHQNRLEFIKEKGIRYKLTVPPVEE
jgi:hypothetical protein